MGHVTLADVSTGVTIGQLANGLIIALAVAVVGGVIAFLLAKNGTAEQAALTTLNGNVKEQSVELRTLQTATTQISTSLGPLLRELEGLGVQVRNIDRDLTILKEWRTAHEKWAGESIARLDQAMRTSRKSDTL